MFSEKIKKARKNAGLSQAELASKLFISQQAYAKYEIGKASPNPEMLAKIAKELNVSVDYLTSDYDYEKIYYNRVSYVLQEARLIADISQNDAAQCIGKDLSEYQAYERGDSKIDSSSLLKLLLKFDCDIYEFMFKCGVPLMERVDKSDYWLASDAHEVAEVYSKLPTPESKNMIRGALGLSPLNTNVKTAREQVG